MPRIVLVQDKQAKSIKKIGYEIYQEQGTLFLL